MSLERVAVGWSRWTWGVSSVRDGEGVLDSYVLVRQWQEVASANVACFMSLNTQVLRLRSSELGASNALLRERDDVITK